MLEGYWVSLVPMKSINALVSFDRFGAKMENIDAKTERFISKRGNVD